MSKQYKYTFACPNGCVSGRNRMTKVTYERLNKGSITCKNHGLSFQIATSSKSVKKSVEIPVKRQFKHIFYLARMDVRLVAIVLLNGLKP